MTTTRHRLVFFDLPTAIRRATWKADRTGVRHRVQVCRIAPADHLVPAVWTDLHYVVNPIDTPVTRKDPS